MALKHLLKISTYLRTLMNSDGLKHVIKCFPELGYCLPWRQDWNLPLLWLY